MDQINFQSSKWSNCFSINQQVGQNIILKKRTETSEKPTSFCLCFEFENRFISLRVVYRQASVSSSANQKAGFVTVHHYTRKNEQLVFAC